MSDGEIKKPEPRRKATEKREPKMLQPGMVTKSAKGVEYLVESKLGQGGFGEVWKVSTLKDPQKAYAMKTEPNVVEPGKEGNLRMKMEVECFDRIQKSRVDKQHFVKMVDKGKTIDFKYYVMDLIWMSLKEVKHKLCGDVFSPHTTINVARQTLKGIEALHDVGILHRDIKPANFAVGLPPFDTVIYLLDFGCSKCFLDKNGNVRRKRKAVPFMGTPMFASVESHCCQEQARRDDLECWLYMILDLYDQNNLPWASLDPHEVEKHIELRMMLLQQARELHAAGKLKAPEKWCDIIEMLNLLDFEEPGNFTQLNLILSQICVDENIDPSLPLDWIGKKEVVKASAEKLKEEAARKQSDKKREARRKKTAERAAEAEKKEADGKKRRKAGDQEDADSGSGEETNEEDSVDYEAYLRWKKRRKSRKKGSRNKHNDPPPSDREHGRKPRAPRKKLSKERKRSEADRDVPKPPEVKETHELKREDDKKAAAAPPEKKEPVEDKKAATPDKAPAETPKIEVKIDKNLDAKRKKPPDVPKKEGNATPESNESNNDREDKNKKKKPPPPKKVRKKGNKTPESRSNEGDDDNLLARIEEQKRAILVRKKDTKQKPEAKKNEAPIEKPALKAPAVAATKAPENRKSDGRK